MAKLHYVWYRLNSCVLNIIISWIYCSDYMHGCMDQSYKSDKVHKPVQFIFLGKKFMKLSAALHTFVLIALNRYRHIPVCSKSTYKLLQFPCESTVGLKNKSRNWLGNCCADGITVPRLSIGQGPYNMILPSSRQRNDLKQGRCLNVLTLVAPLLYWAIRVTPR